MSNPLEELRKLLNEAGDKGLLQDLQPFSNPEHAEELCEELREVVEKQVPPKDLHAFYYLDLANFEVYEVIAIPQIDTPMMKVHDAGRSPASYYLVDPKRLGRTRREAIKVALPELEEAYKGVSQEAEQVEYKRLRIVELLEIGK